MKEQLINKFKKIYNTNKQNNIDELKKIGFDDPEKQWQLECLHILFFENNIINENEKKKLIYHLVKNKII